MHVVALAVLGAGFLFVVVAAFSGCRYGTKEWQASEEKRLRSEIFEIDMGAGVRCFLLTGSGNLSCVQAPLEGADCWAEEP